jgi:hypothetical protein
VDCFRGGGLYLPPRDCFGVLGGGPDPSGTVLRYWRGGLDPPGPSRTPTPQDPLLGPFED